LYHNSKEKMGFYQAIRELYKNPKENLGELWKERLIKWRKGKSIVKIEKPTRLDRARSIGYKAKKGFIVIRVRIKRSRRKKEKPAGGRRPKKYGRRKIVSKSYQWIAEERAQRKYTNLNVLGSYEVAKDGKYYWFEVILIDPAHPQIQNDPRYAWILLPANRRRVFRGLTSAGKKARGLRWKGKGPEKVRPSIRANKGKGK